jgi:hypothetical protein
VLDDYNQEDELFSYLPIFITATEHNMEILKAYTSENESITRAEARGLI